MPILFFVVFNSSSIPARTLTIYTFVVYFPCGVLYSGCLNRVYVAWILFNVQEYLHSQSTAAASSPLLLRPIGSMRLCRYSLIEQTKVNRENTHRQYPQINGFYTREESPRFSGRYTQQCCASSCIDRTTIYTLFGIYKYDFLDLK